MSEYKFISDRFTDEITKKVNKYIKKGWALKEWKLNDNTLVVFLEREKDNESNNNEY